MSSRRIETPIAFKGLYEPHRYKVFYGGRGGAKSWAFADALLALGDSKPLRVLCAREKQVSIKDSVHQLLCDRIKAHDFNGYTVTDTEIKHPNGTRFFFKGLWQNVDNIKSAESIDIVWVEEAHSVSEDSWKKLTPTIRKPGSEIWVSFNPDLKSDAAYQRFVLNPPPNSLVVKVSYQDNPWLSDEIRQEIEHMRLTDYDEYRHVYGGELKEFADGAIYAKQLKQAHDDGRICSIPVESSVEVHTAWDLGRNDTTAIWFFQIVGKEHRFIDYYEHRLVDLDHYIRVLKDRGYNYGTHYLPHDVEVTELSSQRGSRRQILEDGGVKPVKVVPRVADINSGIEVTRKALSRCWFDEKRCMEGLDALKSYQYQWDDKHDTFRKTPVHNWASNGADALRQYAQGFREERKARPIKFEGWAA